MPQIYPGSTCWFPLGQPFHSFLQGWLSNEYVSDLDVIVCWINTLFFTLYFLLHITQDKYELYSTNLIIFTILKTKSRTLLPQQILDTLQSLLPQKSTFINPFLLLHLPNLGYNYWPHPDITLAPPLLLFLLHFFSKKWVHGSWGGFRGGVIEVII